ncbi:type 2 lanthipeptide synthetase LanM [Streptomyces sp. NPDC007100]|uniref:type 2 lanthipeptide synthetase LanM n=1 Tax=Streptomyces sp. NPDC007100 TaxID=3155602 RepID=UPI0033E93081
MNNPEPSVSVPAFLPFYLGIAPKDVFALSLAPVLDEVVSSEHRDGVVHQLWNLLVCTVEGHSYRTLVGEFHAHREAIGLPADAGSRVAMESFTAVLENPAQRRALMSRYPVLQQRLMTVTGNMRDAYREMLEAFRDDRRVLSESFGLAPAGETITALDPSNSDPHNGNRRVCFITTSGGTRLVYKPRSLTGDDFLRDLYRAAEGYLTHSLDTCVPESVTVDDHGWQRFTEVEPMHDAGQASRYFYRFGAITCLLSAVGASDLHDENVLAHGEHPCVIDTETLLRGDSGVTSDSLPHMLINHVKYSVTTTMLLPVENPNSAIDVIMSGAGLVEEQQSKLRRPVVVDPHSDAVRVEWDTLTYRHTTNVPAVGEERISITDHFLHVMAGYHDALAFLRTDRLEKTLADHPAIPIRSVLRATEVYSRYLDASTHPKYLTSRAETRRLYGHLSSSHRDLPDDQVAYLRCHEEQALDAGDIPYFFTQGSSTTLSTRAGSLPGFFKLSPLDNALRGARAAGGRHERYHQFLVEECLGGVANTPQGLSVHSVFAGDTLAKAAPGSWGFGITEVLHDLAITVEGSRGTQAGWVGSIGPDRKAPTITPGNQIAFHDMGGIVRLMRNAAKLNGRYTAWGQAADAGYAELATTYRHILDDMPESVFSGLASVLLTRPHVIDNGWMSELILRMEQRGHAREKDVANGPAGVLMTVLSRIEDGYEHEMQHVDALLRMSFGDAHLVLPGGEMELAHGALGLYWAKARTGRVLGDTALADEAFGWLSGRLDAHRPEAVGWCKGAAGLMVAATEICQAAGRLEWLAEGRLTALVDTATALGDGPMELSVCHGTSGVVQALLFTARSTANPSLVDRARTYQNEVLKLVRRSGFYTGVAGRTSLLGYMLGWSGIADTDLMLVSSAADRRAPVALIG